MFEDLFTQYDEGSSLESILIRSFISFVILLLIFWTYRRGIPRLRKKLLSKVKVMSFSKLLLLGIKSGLLFLGVLLLAALWGIRVNNILEFQIYRAEKFVFTPRSILVLLIILFLMRTAIMLIESLFSVRIKGGALDRGRGKSVLQITKYLLWILGLFLMVASLGLDLTFVIASVSALLVGVGFGMQHIFSDVFSGIIILFDGSIQVGDVVELESIVGRVNEIGLRATKVITRDNVIMIIPNSRFTHEKVINWSHLEQKSRFEVSIGVAYGSDVGLVEKILLEIPKEVPEIADTPHPFVRFEEFGDSSLNFQLFFWTESTFQVEHIKSRLRFLIDLRFRENNVVIPFPQRDVHIKRT